MSGTHRRIPVRIEGDRATPRPERPSPRCAGKENVIEQFNWHRKPSGWSGAPCPVCGCESRRLKAEHRALRAEEAWEYRALWVKRIKVCFGTDSSIEAIRG